MWYHSQNNAVNNYYDSPGGDNPDALIVCGPSVPADHVGDCDSIEQYPAPLNYAWAYVAGNFSPDRAAINEAGSGKVNTTPGVLPFPGQPPTDGDACTAAKNVISYGKSPYAGAGAVPLDAVDQSNLASITLRGCRSR